MPPKPSKKKQVDTVASGSASSSAQPPTLGEQLSYLHLPKPFKNPNYTKNASRRAKNLKTLLSQEKERERVERERRRLEREAIAAQQAEAALATSGAEAGGDGDVAMAPADSVGLSSLSLEEDDMPTYASIEAAPSLLPQRHYCDITGLEAPYTDPVTNLRYHDKSVYELIKNLSPSAVKDYLAARGAAAVLK